MVNSLLHTILSLINNYFWLLLATGPMAFFSMRPLVKEWRQQAVDPIYKKRSRAYTQFKKLPEGSEPKWQAFLNFLAAYFDAKGDAWTASDTRAALEEANVDSQIIAKIEAIHISKDKTLFSRNEETTKIGDLNAIARRVRVAFAKNALILMALFSLLPNESVAASWGEAESACQRVCDARRQSPSHLLYTKSALLFEATAQRNDDAANAFYNAGNAWFQANKLGRAITAYRNATHIRPFDDALLDNLAAARALTLNNISEGRSILERIPSSWLRVVTIVMSFCFWGMMLLCARYESLSWRLLGYASAMVLTLSAVTLATQLNGSRIEGVIITDSVEARKGPAYAYAPAFEQALHDGLEFKLIEERGAWIQIELFDGRRCWIPQSQASRLQAL